MGGSCNCKNGRRGLGVAAMASFLGLIFKRFKSGDPVHKAVNVYNFSRIFNILEDIQGDGCHIEKTQNGLGWKIVVDGYSDTEPSNPPLTAQPDVGNSDVTNSIEISVDEKEKKKLPFLRLHDFSDESKDEQIATDFDSQELEYFDFIVRHREPQGKITLKYSQMLRWLVFPDEDYFNDTTKGSIDCYGSTVGDVSRHYFMLHGWTYGNTISIDNRIGIDILVRKDEELQYVSLTTLLAEIIKAVKEELTNPDGEVWTPPWQPKISQSNTDDGSVDGLYLGVAETENGIFWRRSDSGNDGSTIAQLSQNIVELQYAMDSVYERLAKLESNTQ